MRPGNVKAACSGGIYDLIAAWHSSPALFPLQLAGYGMTAMRILPALQREAAAAAAAAPCVGLGGSSLPFQGSRRHQATLTDI